MSHSPNFMDIAHILANSPKPHCKLGNPRHCQSPQIPKVFDVSQDEVIRKIKLRSGVYQKLIPEDFKRDTVDDPYVVQSKKKATVFLPEVAPKDETKQFNEAYALFNDGKFRQAYAIFDNLASEFSIPGTYYKAIMLYDGKGVKEDPVEAMREMKKVYHMSTTSLLDIEFRHFACYHIANAFQEGRGAKHDEDEAVKWWTLAAEEIAFNPHRSVGDQLMTDAGVLCQTALGYYYGRDRVGAHPHPEPLPNWEKSYMWHSEASRNGSVESVVQVGLMCWYGMGTPADHHLGHEFLKIGADAGNFAAMGHLAVFYIEKSMRESALKWAERIADTAAQYETFPKAIKAMTVAGSHNQDAQAVNKCLATAYFVLAHLYEIGRAVKMDREKASQLYLTAIDLDPDMVTVLGDRIKFGRR